MIGRLGRTGQARPRSGRGRPSDRASRRFAACGGLALRAAPWPPWRRAPWLAFAAGAFGRGRCAGFVAAFVARRLPHASRAPSPAAASLGLRRRLAAPRRCRRSAVRRAGRRRAGRATSNRSTEPATAALSEPIAPRIGMRTNRSQRRRTAGESPWPSLPTTSAIGPRRSASRAVSGASASEPTIRRPRRWRSVRVAGEVVDRREQEVLGRARGRLDRRRRERRLALRREDDAVDAGRLGAAQERADVLRDPRASRARGRTAGSPRSIARARMSSSDANRRASTTTATPWWPSNPASDVSEPPSTSTIGIRRVVAWRTIRSSAWRRCGVTSSRRAGRPAANASSTGRRPATSSSPSSSGGASAPRRAGGPSRRAERAVRPPGRAVTVAVAAVRRTRRTLGRGPDAP